MWRARSRSLGVLLAMVITAAAVGCLYLGLVVASLVLYWSPYGIYCVLGGDLAGSKAPFSSQVWQDNPPYTLAAGPVPSLRYEMVKSLMTAHLRAGMPEGQVRSMLGEPDFGVVEDSRTSTTLWSYKLGYPFRDAYLWFFDIRFDASGRLMSWRVNSDFGID